MRTILLFFFVIGVFGWSYTILMPAFARDVLGRGANGYGILIAASGAGALLGALIVAAYGHLVNPRKLAFGGVYSFSIVMTAFAFARNFYLALVFLFLAGFGMLLFFATSNTTLQTIVPDEMRGRVMGVWSLIFGAMIPLGSLEAGARRRFLGNSVRARLWSDHVPGRGDRYANFDRAPRSGSINLVRLRHRAAQIPLQLQRQRRYQRRRGLVSH